MIRQEIVITNEEITNFLQKYVSEYRRLIEEKYPQLKGETSLYDGYPYEITVFTDKFSTSMVYELNSTAFSIKINKVEKTPELESKTGFLRESYVNIYLKRIMEEPELKAQRDISDLIAFFEHEKQEEEYAQIEWEKYEQEKLDETVEGYTNSLKKAYAVQEKTIHEMKASIYNLIQTIQNQSILLESYLKVGCLTLFDTLFETTNDLESSMFLALHGKYEPAMGLLRRYLETTLCSLYHDKEIAKYKVTSKTFVARRSARGEMASKTFAPKIHWT